MEDLTYEAILRDPALLNKLLRDARCERAEMTGGLLLVALQTLFSRTRRSAAKTTLQTAACG